MDPEAARETAAQLARPSGEAGLRITESMNRINASLTDYALRSLDLAGGDALLEVGPGNGRLSLGAVSSLGGDGMYLAFEYNEDIASVARSTFADASADVEVLSGDFMGHVPGGRRFDALMANNVLYFFDDLDALLRRCREWLRPGGRVAFGVRSMVSLAGLPFVEHGFHLRTLDEQLVALHRAGFGSIEAHFLPEEATDLEGAEVQVDSIVMLAIRS